MTDSVSNLREPTPNVHCPSPARSVPRVSLRTLVLLLELLVAIISLQYLAAARPARAGVVWLGGRCPPAGMPVPAEPSDGMTST